MFGSPFTGIYPTNGPEEVDHNLTLTDTSVLVIENMKLLEQIDLKKALKPIDADLRVEDRFPLLDGFDGTPNSNESYLLLSRYDGDLKEGIVELVDLTNFKVLHTWNPDLNAFNQLISKIDEIDFVEKVYPFAVGIYQLDKDALLEGRSLREQALKEISDLMGLAFDDWDLEFYTNLFQKASRRLLT